MKLLVNIKNSTKAQQIIKLLNEIPYVEVEYKNARKPVKLKKVLPREFREPLKTKSYHSFHREEIYEDILH